MGRKSHAQALSIWANGERVGVWRVPTRGADELHYDNAWVDSAAGRPLSLSLPMLRGAPHRGPVVQSYFDNLLPDSLPIRERLARRFQTQTTQAFDLLQAIGRDCVGAIQLLGEDDSPSNVERIEGVPLDEAQVEQLLELTVDPGRFGTRMAPEDGLRISLAGAQEKTALLWHDGRWLRPLGATPTTHILKLPLGLVGHRRADFSTSVENEWLCLNILKEYGVPVPPVAILRFGAQKVLGVERFDRRFHSSGAWLLRLPQEDFCQALGKPSHLKYEADDGPGLVDLASVLRLSVRGRDDLATLITVQLLFWMLGAPDGHAKNFSIALLPEGRYQLTPIYDVMSIWPVEGNGPNQVSWHDAKLAMAVSGKNKHYRFREVQRRHFNAMAHRCHYGPDAEELIQRVLQHTPDVIARIEARLPAGFPQQVADRILQGLATSASALEAMPRSRVRQTDFPSPRPKSKAAQSGAVLGNTPPEGVAMNVLMVDDHLMFLQGMKNLLNVLVPELRVETTGEMAHAVQLAQLTEFDLVLLDWHLGDGNGEQSIRRLRDAGCMARIVVLSGETNAALIRSSVDLGAAGFIPKKYSSEMMVAALGQRAGRAHLPAARDAQRRAAGRRRQRARPTAGRPHGAPDGCLPRGRARPAEQADRAPARHRRIDREGAPDRGLHGAGRAQPHRGRLPGLARGRAH